MDANLLKAREAFHKKALSLPVVENKRKKPVKSEGEPKEKSQKLAVAQPKVLTCSKTNYKQHTGARFSILATIVQNLKLLHHQGATEAITLDDVLEDVKQPVGADIIQWLETEALRSNPKIEVVDGCRYKFKAPYNIRSKKGLLRMLQKQVGSGGVWLHDVQESLPHHERILKAIGDDVIFVTRPTDKKQVIFHNDKSVDLKIEEDFRMQWRQIAVDGIDDNNIEEYLKKHGIAFMQGTVVKTVPVAKKPARTAKKRAPKKLYNEHVVDILETYS